MEEFLSKMMDEPEHERCVLILRPSWLVFGYLVFLLGVLIAGGSSVAAQFGAIAAAAFALVCVVLTVLLTWVFFRPPRVVTLSRGGIEMRRGKEVSTWRARDFRFAELRHRRDRQARGPDQLRVSCWLAVTRVDTLTQGAHPGWIEVFRYSAVWDDGALAQLQRLDQVLARLGLREKVPAPDHVLEGDPPPRFDVPRGELESSLQELLTRRKGLLDGTRFFADHREADMSDFSLGFFLLLIFGVPTGGFLVSWAFRELMDAGFPTNVQGMVGLVGILFIVLLIGGMPLLGVLLWARRLRVASRIREGTWPDGLYLLEEHLLALRDGKVTVLPRARVLAFTQSKDDGLILEYRSQQEVRAKRKTGMLLREPEGRAPSILEQLEAWRRKGAASFPHHRGQPGAVA